MIEIPPSINNYDTIMEETLLFLAGLVQQEERGYAKYPCLLVPDVNYSYVDVDCRTQMIEWCYQIVEFSRFNRTCVEITMSYVDRYVVTPAGSIALQDRNMYQLACMTALYIAVKIHDDVAVMDPQMISAFSRGTYTPEQVEEMERSMLQALEWKLNPPTTVSYVALFGQLIPDTVLCYEVRQKAYQLAIQGTEVAAADYQLMSTKPSVIAYCSYMNALEYILFATQDANTTLQSVVDPAHSGKLLGYIGFVLAKAIEINDSNDPYIVLVQHRLYESQHMQVSCGGVQSSSSSMPHERNRSSGRNSNSCIVVSMIEQQQQQEEGQGQEDGCDIDEDLNPNNGGDETKDSSHEVSPRMVIID